MLSNQKGYSDILNSYTLTPIIIIIIIILDCLNHVPHTLTFSACLTLGMTSPQKSLPSKPYLGTLAGTRGPCYRLKAREQGATATVGISCTPDQSGRKLLEMCKINNWIVGTI